MSPADKGKSLVVMPLALYQEMTASHTNKDEEVTVKTGDSSETGEVPYEVFGENPQSGDQ